MRKLFFAAAAAGVFAFAGSATADPNPNSETTGNPGNGNQGCYLNATETGYKNPGKMMQGLREAEGVNAAEWVASLGPNAADTVGEWITERRCNPESFPD